ncbi:MAG: preprotein translocase subunit YajC [Muribaculaceae bacterium]|nr:preprotein translocase subunit YajC [Muribaculaceae bacterium]
MITNLVLLQEQAQAGGVSAFPQILMIVALIAIFYFFMIRPQQKRQKEIRKFREGLNVGDRIITAGGIYGKIRGIKENALIIEIADNVKITIDKGSVYPSAADAAQAQQTEENK